MIDLHLWWPNAPDEHAALRDRPRTLGRAAYHTWATLRGFPPREGERLVLLRSPDGERTLPPGKEGHLRVLRVDHVWGSDGHYVVLLVDAVAGGLSWP